MKLPKEFEYYLQKEIVRKIKPDQEKSRKSWK